ncbi:MAG: hypothetical protein HQM04_06585 [Magnetococcales bacterium]|nr:hypothetical protein [Magnetococcales bacterium]MBF0114694.1 hypothetical protein [Magnetococcales bacterium]
MNELTIFRPGTHIDASGTSHTFSAADLQAAADAYDPQRHEAPLCIGHPVHDAPAWGWVKSLLIRDGQLVATPHQVDAEFADMVRNGRFKKLSASFYPPDAPTNPTPGVYALRHIAFLGASPPAVKGLPDARFAEDGGITFYQEFTFMSESERTAKDKEAELQRREAALQSKEAAFAEQERALKLRTVEAQVDKLVQTGKVLPKQQKDLVQFMAALPKEELQFAEGGKVVLGEWLGSFLADLPPQVAFGELAGGPVPGVSMPSPQVGQYDPARLALHRKAQALAKQQNVSFVEAVRQLGG